MSSTGNVSGFAAILSAHLRASQSMRLVKIGACMMDHPLSGCGYTKGLAVSTFHAPPPKLDMPAALRPIANAGLVMRTQCSSKVNTSACEALGELADSNIHTHSFTAFCSRVFWVLFEQITSSVCVCVYSLIRSPYPLICISAPYTFAMRYGAKSKIFSL